MIARKTTSTGTVSVTGAGSTWNAGNNIHIGSDISFSTGTITGAGGNGTLNVANNGAVFVQDIFNAASGRITGGGGTITGNIQNDGTIAAGNSAGLMSIVGNLDHNAGATIEVEIGGTTFNTGISQFDYDRIDVSDDLATTGTTEGVATIDLAAIFSVEFIDGFSAASGDSFDILIADTIVGLITAANFVLPALTAGLEWDGGIFDVSGRDAIRIFVTESAAAAVPEPSSLLILIGGLGLLITARRRRAVTIH
jgi:T5SS/PEP-CTERM-associated repeat protein